MFVLQQMYSIIKSWNSPKISKLNPAQKDVVKLVFHDDICCIVKMLLEVVFFYDLTYISTLRQGYTKWVVEWNRIYLASRLLPSEFRTMLSASVFASKSCKNKKKPRINKFHSNNHTNIVLAQDAWNSTCLITCVTEQGQNALNFQGASSTSAALLQMSSFQLRNEPITA